MSLCIKTNCSILCRYYHEWSISQYEINPTVCKTEQQFTTRTFCFQVCSSSISIDANMEKKFIRKARMFFKIFFFPTVPANGFIHGTGSNCYVPKFLQWKCVFGICSKCGVENKMNTSECRVFDKFKRINTGMMKWILAPQYGQKYVK